LRIDHPHNAALFSAIATLHYLRAQRLAAAEQLAEALAETQAAAVYARDLWPELAKEVEQTRSVLEANMQKLRVEASAPESEQPILPKARARMRQQQAAKGFRLMDAFKRSDEARVVDEDSVIARARQTWEEIGLGPLERADLRPLTLKDAIEAVESSAPATAAAIPSLWNTMTRDNHHLMALDASLVSSFIASRLFGLRFEKLGPAPMSMAPAPLVAAAELHSREPRVYWWFSPEYPWLKLQCVLAVALAVLAFAAGWREWNHRIQRNAAYSEIQKAITAGDSLKVIDSAERFFANPLVGRDVREEQVQDLYSEALVRWFNEQNGSDLEIARRLDRYRQLLHLTAAAEKQAATH
jgi:hypothetical protein